MRGFAADYRAIERAIDRNQILMALVIPPDYAETIAAGGDGAGADPYRRQRLEYGERSCSGTPRAWSAALRADCAPRCMNRRGGERLAPPVDAQLRVWYNSTLESKNYVVPGPDRGDPPDYRRAADVADDRARMGDGHDGAAAIDAAAARGDRAGKDAGVFRCGGRRRAGRADRRAGGVSSAAARERPGCWRLSVCLFLFGALFWGIFVSAAAKTQLPGLPDGAAQLVSAGVHALGVCVRDRIDAAGDSGDHAHRPGAVLS